MMLWTVIVVLFIFWLAGLGFRFGGNLIHILLVLAFIALILRLLGWA